MVLLACLCFALTGCPQSITPQKTETVGTDATVQLLFAKDGHSVYRFADGGRWHYFVIPDGETITTQEQVHHQGKTRRVEKWDENTATVKAEVEFP